MQELYYNVEFAKDGSISTRVGNHSMKLDDELLGNMLGVSRVGIRTVVGKTCFDEFVKKC